MILIINLYSNYGIYMCRSECHGWKIICQVTFLCASTGQALNSSNRGHEPKHTYDAVGHIHKAKKMVR
jgi:hypothetical protein